MKNIFKTVATIAALTAIVTSAHAEKIMVGGYVTEQTNEAIVITDMKGNDWVWELENGERFGEREKIVMVIENNDNENVFDDEIVVIKPLKRN